MITLTFEITFISDETGYSAWVLVSGDNDRSDYANHVGYALNAMQAQDMAFGHASDLQKVLMFAGVQSRLIEGNHDLRQGDKIYRAAIG